MKNKARSNLKLLLHLLYIIATLYVSNAFNPCGVHIEFQDYIIVRIFYEQRLSLFLDSSIIIIIMQSCMIRTI